MGDDLDETVLSRTAFRFLKVMAEYFNNDVHNHRSELADRLLGNLQRYILKNKKVK